MDAERVGMLSRSMLVRTAFSPAVPTNWATIRFFGAADRYCCVVICGSYLVSRLSTTTLRPQMPPSSRFTWSIFASTPSEPAMPPWAMGPEKSLITVTLISSSVTPGPMATPSAPVPVLPEPEPPHAARVNRGATASAVSDLLSMGPSSFSIGGSAQVTRVTKH